MGIALTAIEEEVILLSAVWEIIDSIVNYEVLQVYGSDPNSSVLFRSATHQKFFNIVLVDFLSCTDGRAPVKKTSYLSALRSIAASPSLDIEHSVSSLAKATQRFVVWLEQEVDVDLWLPSIDEKTVLTVSRMNFLKMCGNLSKHNFLRSGRVAEELCRILTVSGVSIGLDDALLALADFYERFHTDVFNYHSSTIAELLNNIRWGIYEYLQPERCRSITWDDGEPTSYRYTYPSELSNQLAKACYWELMNAVRSQPYVRQFEVTSALKQRY